MQFQSLLVVLALAASASAAMIRQPAGEKRLFGPAPTPTIPAGLEATDSGCFDAGDCFAYQYPDFKAQCISGKCYKPVTQSNPLSLPTLPSFGFGAPGASATSA